jgi:Spy/CpxP family protein refolding chaperone
MKKTLFIAIPVGLLLIFGGIQVVHSCGSGGYKSAESVGRRFGERGDFLFYRLDRMSEKLHLTSEQKADLEELKNDLQTIMDDRFEERQQFRKSLGEQLSKEQLDTRAITNMLHSQVDDRARFSHQLVDHVGEFLGRLTPEQKKELSDTLLKRFQD